jgi:hypothetical protein
VGKTVKSIKIQDVYWEKIFTNYISEKGLVDRISFKDLPKLNKKK